MGDLQKTLCWLKQHNSFTVYNGTLTCLSTGLTADDKDGINCDSGEVGGEIQKQTGVYFCEISLKKCFTVK